MNGGEHRANLRNHLETSVVVGIDLGSAAGDRTIWADFDGRGRLVGWGQMIDLDEADCRRVDTSTRTQAGR